MTVDEIFKTNFHLKDALGVDFVAR